jgi:crossover junction endodeoxyribonuclease RuvC
MGYAVVERSRVGFAPVAFGVLKTAAGESQGERLRQLRVALLGVIADTTPEVAAVERLFFTTNVKTAMSVGQAAGVALATAAEAGLEVVDYTPNEVKQAVAGYGSAGKAQVQAMVTALLRLDKSPRPPDAADACALAICHINRSGLRRALEGARR